MELHEDGSPRERLFAAVMALAEDAIGCSDPNPRVGCVIVGSSGAVLASGRTQVAGGPHAEVMALREAQANGRDVRGATVYVSLEPCSHHGRTPPCCDALIQAGVARVVVALEDPNPRVAGTGIARLRAAGIDVELAGGEWAEASRELNIGFFSRMLRGRPWLRMKLAGSLDGRTALVNGQSQWITGEPARVDGHAWRKRAGGVLTGIGTVREDDPRLDVRLVSTERQPLRVIVDSRLEIDPRARVLQPPGNVLLYTSMDEDVAVRSAVGASNVEVKTIPSDSRGKVDLQRMLEDLAKREINELHVEAGEKLNGSLLATGVVDELLVYMAPRLLGVGRGLASLGPFSSLSESLDYAFVDVRHVGADLRLRLRPLEGGLAAA